MCSSDLINASLEETFSHPALSTREISKMISITGRACKNGQTAKSTKENGKSIIRITTVKCFIETGASIMASGL